MSADEFLNYLTQALFLLIALSVTARALARPLRANVDTALFFGLVALAITEGWAVMALQLSGSHAAAAIGGMLIMAMPYLLLRLLADFSEVRPLIMRLAEVGLILSLIGLAVLPSPLPLLATLAMVVYFALVTGYAAFGFFREARRASGVTGRRMRAVAAGSFALGLVIVLAGAQVLDPELATLWTVLSRLLGLASGLGFFIGFAPPGWLRRAWQEPELRAFLGRAASLPRLPDTASIVQALEQGTAAALGAPGATVGLWAESEQVLRFGSAAPFFEVPSGRMLAGQAFADGRSILSTDPPRDDPEHAELYRAARARAVLAAPIAAGQRRLGVLVVYSPRAPIFAEDDLLLVQLLADQAAVILESRALIDEAARVQAREEATRLKDDFLSSAAHDLKTPLTVLMTQAQMLERRAVRHPDEPADLDGIRRVIREVRRLNRLVLELLDVSRLEQGRLLGPRESVDLVALARQVCRRHASAVHPCQVEANAPLVGWCDPVRVLQLLDNLLENAVKYSPDGGEIHTTLAREADQAHLVVADPGIGIPSEDLPRLFERFHRGSNVDDRRFSGMGLGLYICRGIVEQHGGRIWADSEPGRGSAFHVLLPLESAAEAGVGAVSSGGRTAAG